VSEVRNKAAEPSGPPPAIEPDPGLDRMLEMLGTAIPPAASEGGGYFDNFGARSDDRINQNLMRSALGGGFPSAVDLSVDGILIPKKRTPAWVYAVGGGGAAVALVLLGAIGYVLYLRMHAGPELASVDRVPGAEYVPSTAVMTAAPTAAPATVAAMTAEVDTAMPESAPASAATDEIAYDPDEETKKTMAAMGAKGKPAGGAKRPVLAKGDKSVAPGGDGDAAAGATAAAKPAGPAGTKVLDSSKSGAFGEDLSSLLEKKKDDAATAAPATAAAAASTGRVLSSDEVKAALAKIKSRVALCGKIEETDITVTFEIGLDGVPAKVTAKPPHAADAVGACVTGIIKAAKFPEHDDKPKPVSVSYKLVGAAE
jgi:hypothetical protein